MPAKVTQRASDESPLILVSPHAPSSVMDRLRNEVDSRPSFLRSLLTLSAHYYRGTSPVCGTIGESRFELLNRSGPAFSLRARGSVTRTDEGTEIQLTFRRPAFIEIYPGRYRHDRDVIIAFLKQRLGADEAR